MTEPLLIQKLSANLSYLTERQAVLSQNIANIDTPRYKANDLKKVDFNKLVATNSRLEMKATSLDSNQREEGSCKGERYRKTET